MIEGVFVAAALLFIFWFGVVPLFLYIGSRLV